MSFKIKKRNPYSESINSIKVLLLREFRINLAKSRLGLIWILLEPLTSVILLGLILRPLLGRQSVGEIPQVFFLLCGFVLLKTFTEPMLTAINILKKQKKLLVFKQVTPFDIFVSQFLYQFLVSISAFICFIIGGICFQVDMTFNMLHIFFLCFLFTWIYGCGCGLVVGSLVYKYSFVKGCVAFITRPLLFISCVIFSYNIMPPIIQKALLYNPLVHTIELLRMSFFYKIYKVDQVNLFYPMLIALISLMFGMVTYINNRKNFV